VTDGQKRRRGRPATGVTPKRNLRIGAVWDEAEQVAHARGEKISDVVRPIIERGLKRYIRQHRAERSP
jgi:hypothetical protein